MRLVCVRHAGGQSSTQGMRRFVAILHYPPRPSTAHPTPRHSFKLFQSRVLDKVSKVGWRDRVLFIGPSSQSRTFLFLPVKTHSSHIEKWRRQVRESKPMQMEGHPFELELSTSCSLLELVANPIPATRVLALGPSAGSIRESLAAASGHTTSSEDRRTWVSLQPDRDRARPDFVSPDQHRTFF